MSTLLHWGSDIHHTAVAISDDPRAPRVTALHLSQKERWKLDMLKMLLVHKADIRTEPRNLRNLLEYVLNLKRLEHLRDDEKDQAIIHLIYSAGATMCKSISDMDNYKHLIPQFILDDQEPLLPLTGLCRRCIRLYLLNPAGGNHANLLTAVPWLPVPAAIRDFLLFNIDLLLEPEDIMDSSQIQQKLLV